MKFFNYVIFIFSTGLLFSCLEPYEPEISGGSDSFLVVDGLITSGPGPYTVKISKSYSLNESESAEVMVGGLDIKIEEEDGPIETLIETADGIYQTNSIQGKIGARYRMKFMYKGKQYQSLWEKMGSSSLIDSVYYSEEIRQTTNKEDEIKGLQFYIDSYGSSEDAAYYRYEWEETWEIGVVYKSLFDYVGNDTLIKTTNPRHTCWKYESQSAINITSSKGLSENIISEHPLTFITGEDERFAIKYSFLVKQYALDENEYSFWKSLRESNEQLGSLYDKQPANIKGNIFNISDKTEIVLGYFSASGVQEKRVIIKDAKHLSSIAVCKTPLDTLLKSTLGEDYESAILAELDRGMFFYDFVSTMSQLEPLGAFLSSPNCSDCQLKGGDVNKPIYWDE